jgi:hypothetical protein
MIKGYDLTKFFAIDHRTWKTVLPVRSATLKPCAGQLVVGWVTISEYWLLIVFSFWLIRRREQWDGRTPELTVDLLGSEPGRSILQIHR